MRRLSNVVIAVVTVLLLTGACATAIDGAAIAGGTPPVAQSSSVPPPSPTSDEIASTTTAATVEPAPAVAPSADPFAGAIDADSGDFPGTVTRVGFSIAPGDIACGFHPSKPPSVVCQLDHHTYPNPPQDCHGGGAPGAAVVLTSGGPAEFLCAGDLESGGPTLDTGTMIMVGDLRCVGLQQGVACRDTVTGNGFRLTTADYDLTNGDADTGAGAASTQTSHS